MPVSIIFALAAAIGAQCGPELDNGAYVALARRSGGIRIRSRWRSMPAGALDWPCPECQDAPEVGMGPRSAAAPIWTPAVARSAAGGAGLTESRTPRRRMFSMNQ